MTTEMHWARWGDPDQAAALPEAARGLVELAFGPAEERATTPLAEVRLPEPALAAELLAGLRDLVGDDHVHTDHETRVRHTRGKSTPDLLRMRAGDGSDAPDVVVRPAGHDEVQALVTWCAEHRVALVPFGGGTSVVGGLTVLRDGYAGVVSLDLRRLDGLVSVDAESRTAVLQAGVLGPAAEELLGEHGLMLGHFPQSYRYASIGGFAATRSSGQASSGYGRFDALVVGLTVATPIGTLELGSAPASAAGPDLRQLVLGSEGAFGVITSVTVRVRPVPSVKVYDGWRFDSFAAGHGRPAHARAVRLGADRAPAVRRERDGDQPRPARPGRRRERGRLPDDRRVRGRAGRRRARPGRRRRPAGGGRRRPGRDGRVRRGTPAGSTARTSATRCSTSASSSRPWRPRRSGPACPGCTAR